MSDRTAPAPSLRAPLAGALVGYGFIGSRGHVPAYAAFPEGQAPLRIVAVANGLSYQAALAAVTINPAKIWGFGDRTGSIEVGKDADLVLWSGDPFETSTYPVAVFVGGQQQPQDARILKLRDRYAKPSPDGYPREYH